MAAAPLVDPGKKAKSDRRTFLWRLVVAEHLRVGDELELHGFRCRVHKMAGCVEYEDGAGTSRKVAKGTTWAKAVCERAQPHARPSNLALHNAVLVRLSKQLRVLDPAPLNPAAAAAGEPAGTGTQAGVSFDEDEDEEEMETDDIKPENLALEALKQYMVPMTEIELQQIQHHCQRALARREQPWTDKLLSKIGFRENEAVQGRLIDLLAKVVLHDRIQPQELLNIVTKNELVVNRDAHRADLDVAAGLAQELLSKLRKSSFRASADPIEDIESAVSACRHLKGHENLLCEVVLTVLAKAFERLEVFVLEKKQGNLLVHQYPRKSRLSTPKHILVLSKTAVSRIDPSQQLKFTLLSPIDSGGALVQAPSEEADPPTIRTRHIESLNITWVLKDGEEMRSDVTGDRYQTIENARDGQFELHKIVRGADGMDASDGIVATAPVHDQGLDGEASGGQHRTKRPRHETVLDMLVRLHLADDHLQETLDVLRRLPGVQRATVDGFKRGIQDQSATDKEFFDPIKDELEALSEAAHEEIDSWDARALLRVAAVGFTQAGKSTLLSCLLYSGLAERGEYAELLDAIRKEYLSGVSIINDELFRFVDISSMPVSVLAKLRVLSNYAKSSKNSTPLAELINVLWGRIADSYDDRFNKGTILPSRHTTATSSVPIDCVFAPYPYILLAFRSEEDHAAAKGAARAAIDRLRNAASRSVDQEGIIIKRALSMVGKENKLDDEDEDESRESLLDLGDDDFEFDAELACFKELYGKTVLYVRTALI